MGILDSLESMAAGATGPNGNPNAKVAGGLVEALQQHPGGLGAILQNFRNNGLADHANAIQNGQAPQMTPDHVQTGLQGTGLLDKVAERAGVSPEVAKVALATVLPIVMAHMQRTGSAPSGNVLGSLLSQL